MNRVEGGGPPIITLRSALINRPQLPLASGEGFAYTVARGTARASEPARAENPTTCPPNFSRMNIHEYQARELFEKYGVASPTGQSGHEPEEAEAVARELGREGDRRQSADPCGRPRKGEFKNGFKGGVHLCSTSGGSRGGGGEDARPGAGHAPDGAGRPCW